MARIVVGRPRPHTAGMQPSQPIRLFRHPISGHSHRVELYLSLLGLPFELVHVELMKGQHKQPEFLAMNRFGQVPVIQDGDFTLADSNAILVYLGERYDRDGRFWPRTPEGKAQVQRWLSVAAGQIAYGPAAARRVKLLGAKDDYEQAVALTQRTFDTLEAELSQHPFLVGEQPSVADLALYAYVARAPEGGVSLEKYAALRGWLERIEKLPGFVPMLTTQQG